MCRAHRQSQQACQSARQSSFHVLSSKTMLVTHVRWLLLASRAVYVTDTVPVSAQVKLEGDTVAREIAQLSVLLPPTTAGLSVSNPLALR